MHPILFQLGFLTLRSYGAMMALSFTLGILVSVYLNRKDGRSDDIILDLSSWVMLGAVVGARALYVVVQPAEYLAEPWKVIAVWEGGLVYYGGLIGATITAYWYLRRTKAPIWAIGDCVAPGLALGQVSGRFGCWFNGCCYGREDQVHGVIFPSLGDNIPHLPVMLYEAAFCLGFAILLFRFWHHKRFHGQIFWSFVLGYGLWRFGIEFLRGDVERGVLINGALSPSQWISLFGVGMAFFMLRKLSQQSPQKAA